MTFPKDPAKTKKEQLERLKSTVKYTYDNSRYFNTKMKKAGFLPGKVKTIRDLSYLPVTTKKDLRENNWDIVAVPRSRWVDLVSTSGTTGQATYIPLTKKDLKRVGKWGGQTLSLMGLKKTDIVQMTLPLGSWMWMAGFGFYLCYTDFGCCVLRFGPGFTDKQIDIMEKLGSTIVHGVPSFMVRLGTAVRDSLPHHSVSKVATIGENVMSMDLKKNAMGQAIENIWEAELFSTYGCSEGPIVCGECTEHQGMHVHPFETIIEIVDPETYEPVKEGGKGVITITPLNVEAFPILRYAIGDLSFLVPGDCPCGAYGQRLGPIYSRIDHMMKIKGVVVYPEVIKEIISREPIVEQFQIEAYTENFMDNIRLWCSGKGDQDHISDLLRKRIKGALGISVDVNVLSPAEVGARVMPQGINKPIVFLDAREKK
ncbi:MAG: AMP-binding protein [Chloroflexi bacterium]|nr:AMP-binding protein [Chloroflexota bacterium]